MTLTLTLDQVIRSCISYWPLSTDEISVKSEKLFVGTDVRTNGWTGVPTDGHLSLSNVIRSTRRSRPKYTRCVCTIYYRNYYHCWQCCSCCYYYNYCISRFVYLSVYELRMYVYLAQRKANETKSTPAPTKCFLTWGRNFSSMRSWCSWNRSSLGKPGMKNPVRQPVNRHL